ncbi:MAG: type IV pilus modification protein PilV [Xylophilus ampelinus]
MFRCLPPRRFHEGFTLVEVLVAIVVLSFGVLGLVGLQALSLQSTREARLQSSAVRLAEEMAELMRINKMVAIKTTAAENPYLIDNFTGTVPATSANCFTAACTSGADLARWDVANWLDRIRTELPGARVVICADSVPYDSGGLPRWACDGNAGMLAIKIGWTRGTTQRGSTDGKGQAVLDKATDANARPGVVFSLVPGL